MIGNSVGRRGRNLWADVNLVQQLLRDNHALLAPARIDMQPGQCNAAMEALIDTFQKKALGMAVPTGLVEPNSRTWFALNKASGGSSDNTVLDNALLMLESEAVNFSVRFIGDASVRANYVAQATQFAEETVALVNSGALTPRQGAERAHAMRNSLLDAGRLKSSDIGRAAAELEKATGLTLEQLTTKYAKQLFTKEFAQLTAAEQDQVLLAVVRASGRPNAQFTAAARNLGKVGRGLVLVSIAMAAYSIASSDRPGREAVKQGTTAGLGFLGSLAGGAAAGLVCGPGAPVCVGIGAVIGGAAFAFGADMSFDWLWE
jgi:hypothetical protein